MSTGATDGLLKRHVLGVVAAAFVAGTLFGIALPKAVELLAASEPESAEEFYVRELTARYRLTPRQVELVRMVLQSRNEAYLQALLADSKRLPEQLRFQIEEVRHRAEERIKSVLTAEQLRQFLRDSTPEELAPGTAGSQNRDDKR